MILIGIATHPRSKMVLTTFPTNALTCMLSLQVQGCDKKHVLLVTVRRGLHAQHGKAAARRQSRLASGSPHLKAARWILTMRCLENLRGVEESISNTHSPRRTMPNNSWSGEQ